MMNREILKQVNSLLSQIIELSENELNVEQILELATNAARQWNNFSSSRLPASFHTEKPQNEKRENSTLTSENASKQIDLLKLIEPANRLLKYIQSLGPIMPGIIDKPKPAFSGVTAIPSQNRDSRKIFIRNLLILILLPVLFINFFSSY